MIEGKKKSKHIAVHFRNSIEIPLNLYRCSSRDVYAAGICGARQLLLKC